MSYADYRTGGGRRPIPPRDPGAYDSFAAAGAQRSSSQSRPSQPPPARQTPPTSVPTQPMQHAQPPASNASMFATNMNRPVENPYATSAYASSRGGVGVGGAGGPLGGAGAGMGAGGGGPEFYASARAKGNRQRKFKDTIKNTMAAAKQDNWKVVCVKATSHEIRPPKGKHVRVIMQGLQWGGSITNRESPAGGIFYHLRKRMMQNEWVVATKAQTVFHHIFREGNEKFVEYIAANARSVFRMEFFGEASSDGFAHAGFIKSYGAYIEQWLAMKAAIQFPVGKSREEDPSSTARYRESSIEELLAALPLLMDTLTALFAIELAGQIKFSAVATPCFSMILRDLTLIWVALSEGMIRLLDLYFNLQIPLATIALDVYKRFVDLVGKAQPFFDLGKSLNVRWDSPQLGSISLELLESMTQYLSIGPQDPNANQNPTFSDEEEYEPEPAPEPEPDHYYEPEPEYYSEEEPEIEPPRLPTPSPSSSEYESESESSSSEEEQEELPRLPTPPPPPPPKQFDPLADLLGITNGVGPANGVAAAPANQVAVYMGGTPGLMQRAALEHTVDDRVANVKGMMAAAPQARNGQQQPAQRSGFGVDGTNMQLALYGQQQAQQTPQQQMYAAAMQQQQQQQMAAYQTMAAYQSMAMYQSMAGMNPGMAPNVMQQQQFAAAAMAAQQQQQQQQRGVMAGAAYMPMPQGNSAVPAMRAESQSQPAGSYRVQRAATEKKRVSDSDAAFGPLLDQMKKSSLGK